MNEFPYFQHFVAKISFNNETVVDEKLIDNVAGFLIRGLPLTVVSLGKHEFTNNGFTKFWVLSESHLVIHSWPEHGFIHLDLMTCSRLRITAKTIRVILIPIGGTKDIDVVNLVY